MQVTAVIAEYNPFHNGHKYHIEQTWKKTDNSFIMAIMSGNFVQRGEPALLDKRERARIALMNGADLVVELPVQWATASAERFARGAVYIAHQAGIVNNLSFGCEYDDIVILQQIARLLNDKVYSREIKNYYDEHMCSYPEARAAVVSEILGKDCSRIMMQPNNILAIEYLKALISFRSDIKPVGIERNSTGHDSSLINGNITSAMNIRNLVKTNKDYGKFVPENSIKVFQENIEKGTFPSLYSNLETAVLAHLRKMQPSDFIGTPDVAEGIEHRIVDAVKTSVSLNEIFDKVKTKRYTHARIRRIILSSFLGITAEDVISLPPYIRVLGLNDNGRMMLKEMKNKYFVPVIMKYGDVKYLDNDAKRIFALESTATDLYNLSLPERRICGTDMTDEIVYIPNK
ncbi:MAG: nucleotidyltransferase family protein [Clostridia bacterium]|nr:nucleotidyltransferase family protein [Clostridia bacterium]